MAILLGAIQFKGKLKGIRSYYDSDAKKQVLAEIGHVGKNLIKNNPTLAKVKKLNKEWVGCNMCSALIRKGLNALEDLMKGRNNGRLLSIMKRIQAVNPYVNLGKRDIELSKYKHLLVGFNLNSVHPFKEVFFGNLTLSISADRKEVKLEILKFKSKFHLHWSESINNYRIYLTIAQVSDIIWTESFEYLAPNYQLQPSDQSRTKISEWMDVNDTETDIQLSVSFPENYTAKDQMTIVVGMGLEFASFIEGNTVFAVKGRGTCAIVECF